MSRLNEYIEKQELLGQLEHEYFNWLCGLVKVESAEYSYWSLASILYNIPFRWYVPNDDNRIDDVFLLREEWEDLVDVDDMEYKEVSVFEVLISLSKRFEFLVGGDYQDTYLRFWEMVSNLGLDIFEDGVQNTNIKQEIHSIVNVFLERLYHEDGRGGLFPLKYPREDQREVEIWYQMNAYLDENYVIDEDFV